MSDSTSAIDQGEKKQLYERIFKTANYFVYDPYNPQSLEGWQMGANQRYQTIQPNSQGWLWCDSLELWLGLWEGSIDRDTTLWLRFYDLNENLVLLPEEAAEQKAEQAERKAEQAEQKAEQAEQIAHQERLRAERLAEQLRTLGISPDP